MVRKVSFCVLAGQRGKRCQRIGAAQTPRRRPAPAHRPPAATAARAHQDGQLADAARAAPQQPRRQPRPESPTAAAPPRRRHPRQHPGGDAEHHHAEQMLDRVHPGAGLGQQLALPRRPRPAAAPPSPGSAQTTPRPRAAMLPLWPITAKVATSGGATQVVTMSAESAPMTATPPKVPAVWRLLACAQPGLDGGGHLQREQRRTSTATAPRTVPANSTMTQVCWNSACT